jgi:DNA-binding PucR family transcriptional regulator
MVTRSAWDPPSKPVAELIRGIAAATLDDPSPLLEVTDEAVRAVMPERISADPSLLAGMRAANQANLNHWIAANAAAPGMRVPANLGPEVLDLSRDIVRRGFDDTVLNSYRVGQNAALRFLIDLAFGVTSDLAVLRELLDVTTRSVFAFVDDTVAGIEEQIEREREQLTRGTHAERLEVVNLILEGAPITARRASTRLGYELSSRHRAAVIWSGRSSEQGRLELTADALARAAGAERPFTVVAGAHSIWVWLAVRAETETAELLAALPEGEEVRVALGSTSAGIDGFRRSHLDALATQRLMLRMPAELRLATYSDIELVAIGTQDEQLAGDFVSQTLGALATADPTLRETLRAYIREQFNTSAAARTLFTHRNTVLNRLQRARELLPAPLEGRGLEVGLALEIVHWLGAPREDD